jgi:hypothetical protein
MRGRERNIKIIVILFFSIVLGMDRSSAQSPLFTEEAIPRGAFHITDHQYWGSGISFHDWDRDGWPDLTYLHTGLHPLFLHNDNGQFSQVVFFVPNTHEAKSILWVDYDNDGHSDIFVTRFQGPWSLHRNNGDFSFTDVTAAVGMNQVPGAQTMGAAWADVNRDGYLDAYVCNYNFNFDGTETITNYLFESNGDGTFSEVAMQRGIDNGAQPSFQPAFIDYNNDGWPDLHVINDRNPWTNALYLNNGDGTFTDVSQQSGVGVSIDAMSNTIGDFDNDGLLDIYMSNNQTGNVLFRNAGDGTFSDVAPEAGVGVYELGWGSLWLDLDLDGWQDLFVATSPLDNLIDPQPVVHNFVFTNQADGTFAYREDSGMEDLISRSYCAATADFDNDGAPDIAISCREPYRSELWRNNSQGHNYLKVSLEGTLSNRDAIGSSIHCYSGGAAQMRYTMCGEAYFAQSSQYQIFGLGDSEVVDSLTVFWPSGATDKYYDLTGNQWMHIVEGSSQDPVGAGVTAKAVKCRTFGRLLSFSENLEKIEILDLSGRAVHSVSKLESSERIDLSELASGIYVVRGQDIYGNLVTQRISLR